MIKLTYDTEGITSCPMNGTATWEECMDCKYCEIWENEAACRYKDEFPEEEQ